MKNWMRETILLLKSPNTIILTSHRGVYDFAEPPSYIETEALHSISTCLELYYSIRSVQLSAVWVQNWINVNESYKINVYFF